MSAEEARQFGAASDHRLEDGAVAVVPTNDALGFAEVDSQKEVHCGKRHGKVPFVAVRASQHPVSAR